MPVENLEEQGLEKNPNLELAQWKYLLTTDKYKNDAKIRTNLLKAIEADSKWKPYLIQAVKWLAEFVSILFSANNHKI